MSEQKLEEAPKQTAGKVAGGSRTGASASPPLPSRAGGLRMEAPGEHRDRQARAVTAPRTKQHGGDEDLVSSMSSDATSSK